MCVGSGEDKIVCASTYGACSQKNVLVIYLCLLLLLLLPRARLSFTAMRAIRQGRNFCLLSLSPQLTFTVWKKEKKKSPCLLWLLLLSFMYVVLHTQSVRRAPSRPLFLFVCYSDCSCCCCGCCCCCCCCHRCHCRRRRRRSDRALASLSLCVCTATFKCFLTVLKEMEMCLFLRALYVPFCVQKIRRIHVCNMTLTKNPCAT